MAQTKARNKQFYYTFNGQIMSAIQGFDPSPEGGDMEFVRQLRPDGKPGPAKDTGIPSYRISITQEMLQEGSIYPPWFTLAESRDRFELGEIRKDGSQEFIYIECYVVSVETSSDEHGNATATVNVIARERQVIKA